jgi:hypothetical protein
MKMFGKYIKNSKKIVEWFGKYGKNESRIVKIVKR